MLWYSRKELVTRVRGLLWFTLRLSITQLGRSQTSVCERTVSSPEHLSSLPSVHSNRSSGYGCPATWHSPAFLVVGRDFGVSKSWLMTSLILPCYLIILVEKIISSSRIWSFYLKCFIHQRWFKILANVEKILNSFCFYFCPLFLWVLIERKGKG